MMQNWGWELEGFSPDRETAEQQKHAHTGNRELVENNLASLLTIILAVRRY